MYYIWRFNKEDTSTFYYVDKMPTLEMALNIVFGAWGMSDVESVGEKVRKRDFVLAYDYSPYSFLIEYIGD